MEQIRQLRCLPFITRNVRDEIVDGRIEHRLRQTNFEAFWQMLAALPNRRLKCEVVRGQLRRSNPKPRGQLFNRNIGWQFGLLEVDRTSRYQARKILVDILINLLRREESDIEVPRRKSERPAVVLAQDVHIRCVAIFAHRAPRTGKTVVVCGNGHGPIAGDRIVVSKESCGGLRRGKRIVTFIDDVINAHESSTRAACELPYAGCANVRACIRII